MSKTKLIFHSNGPHAATGYANQCSLICPKLVEAGYDVKISSFYGIEGNVVDFQGIPVLPSVGGTFGMESLPHHVERFFGDPKGGLVVTLADVWVFDAEACRQWNTVCWTPVDHEPVQPRVARFFRHSHAVPVAMSRPGQFALQEFDPLYVPHAIDTKQLLPLGRELARKRLGIPQDAFLIGMVAANKGNPSRKSFVPVLEAFAEVRARHENAILYLHTDIVGEWTGGVPLPQVMEALDLPEASIKFADQYRIRYEPVPTRLMALLYSAMDVLANPSTGEGFGIPILEALACGTPVVGCDFTAMRETVGVGWRVGGWRHWTPQGSWQLTPSVEDLVQAFEECFALSPKERAEMALNARKFALRYDVNTVMDDFMLPALEEAERRFARRKPIVVPARKTVAA